MKKRVNLFSQRTTTVKISSYFAAARKISLIVLAVLIVLGMSLGGVYVYFDLQMKDLDKNIRTYERFVTLNKPFSQELQRFIFKYNLLNSYLEEDADSYDYYQKLQDVLAASVIPKELTSYSIDNNRNISFQLDFTGYEDAIRFIEEMENSEFLDNFETISLSSFNAVSDSDTEYHLQLEGTFIPLNTTNES